jgi:hypothetical protein
MAWTRLLKLVKHYLDLEDGEIFIVIDQTVTKIVSGLHGKTPSTVQLGVGSFLTMDFGAPAAGMSGRGEWFLWLYMCMWRIETQDEVLIGSEDSRETIKKWLEYTTLGSVQKINISWPSLDIAIQFNSGIRILTFSYTTRGDEQWMLFTPEGKVLTIYGGGRFHYGSSSEPRHVIEPIDEGGVGTS